MIHFSKDGKEFHLFLIVVFHFLPHLVWFCWFVYFTLLVWPHYSGARLIRMPNVRKIMRIIWACELSETKFTLTYLAPLNLTNQDRHSEPYIYSC